MQRIEKFKDDEIQQNMENEHDEIASRFKKLRSKPLPIKNV